jgi:putative ABC transport system substrate-binding protein
MRRREFMGLVGGLSAAWPLTARAQQVGRIRRIGVLPTGYRQTDPEGQARVATFLETLGMLGWNDGRNVRLDVRWPGNEIERIREETAALVGAAPDAMVISSNAALAVMQKLDKTTPTIFVQVSDPVGSGFVRSLSRPDGNVTGFQNFEPAMGGKWLGLVKEAAPRVARVGVLVYADTTAHFEFLRAAEAVAPSLGVHVSAISSGDGDKTARDIAGLAEAPDGGLIVLPHPRNVSSRDPLIELAARLRLPAIYPFRFFATAGGLMSYGFDQLEHWRGAAGYIDRVLRGARPADLPVQAPARFELVVNLAAAKAIGLIVPPNLLARADAVIE